MKIYKLLIFNNLKNYIHIKIHVISTIFICIFSLNYGFSQYSVSGNVLDFDHSPLNYFNAVLYNKTDSSLVIGGIFIDGYYKLNIQKHGLYYLQISYAGYNTVKVDVDLIKHKEIILDSIFIHPIQMKEVVISAKRQVYSQDKGKLIVNVQSTSLADVGNAIDVLKRSPNVIVDNSNNITVFGKSSFAVFINGKEITSNKELELLQSNDIESVTIDKNPSAEYSASDEAVINIKTKKIKNETLNIEFVNEIDFSREISFYPQISINNKKGKFTNFFSYNFDLKKSKNSFNEYLNNSLSNNYISSKINDKRKDIGNDFFIGSAFELDSNNTIGLQYSFYVKNYSMYRNTMQDVFNKDTLETINFNIENAIKGKEFDNDISLFYNKAINKANLLTIFDFASINNNDTSLIKEKNICSQTLSNLKLNNDEKYRLFTFDMKYSNKFPFSIESTIGIKFSKILSSGTSSIYDLNNNSNIYYESNEIDDKVGASYLVINKKINKVSVSGGLRCEFSKSGILLDNNKLSDSLTYKVFPNFMIDIPVNDNISSTLVYTTKIKRPTFSMINPTLFYIDSLSYRTGNPLLKPTINHNISLNISLFKKINMSVDYTKIMNDIYTVILNDETNSSITKYTYLNILQSSKIITSLSSNFSGKKYNNYSSFGISFPFADIPYLSGIIKNRNPIYYFNINNDYNINESISISCNFNYKSRGNNQNISFKDSYNLYFGITSKLLKSKLLITLEMNDILRTSNQSWFLKYGNIEMGQLSNYDYRYFGISIRYNFNDFNDIFEKYSNNDEEKNRLK